MRHLVLGLSTLALAACGATETYTESAEYAAEPAPMSSAMDQIVVTGSRKASPAPRPQDQTSSNPTSQSFLAYRYNYGFELPSKTVAPTSQSHADMCRDAGANKCQILSSSTNDSNGNYVNARLALRADPEWLEIFMTDIKKTVSDAEGRMTSNSVSAEDLTRSILDTDARLKAQTTLRNRLQGLLETRNAKLPDLLALERELARVQGEIESATTTLAVLRQRVSMSRVDINYTSKPVAINAQTTSPIVRALKGFIGDFSHGLAGVITFLAGVLPWLILVVLPGLWLVRWLWRRRKSKKV